LAVRQLGFNGALGDHGCIGAARREEENCQNR
jgi:hypothetical protein